MCTRLWPPDEPHNMLIKVGRGGKPKQWTNVWQVTRYRMNLIWSRVILWSAVSLSFLPCGLLVKSFDG